jgi:hypothetical protein
MFGRSAVEVDGDDTSLLVTGKLKDENLLCGHLQGVELRRVQTGKH